MTRRKPRITSIEEADAALERLGWLKTAGSPNAAIRELWDVAVAYRAALHRQSMGEVKRPGFVELVEKKRK